LATCRTTITGHRSNLTFRGRHPSVKPVNPMPTRETP
jgi:hypothetical protein